MSSETSSVADLPSSGPSATVKAPGRGLILSLAIAAGVAVANIYYNQPMLGVMQKDLPGPVTGYVATATQAGYALGLFLLVPLGDLIERRRLIVVKFVLLALALAGAAAAPTAWALLAASLVIGILATVAQQIIPLTAHIAPPQRRGAIMGTVMAGLLCGILLSRTVSGFVATQAGWREMFWLAVPLALVAAVWCALRLPQSRPDSGRMGYGRLMLSMVSLWQAFPSLRLAAITQGFLFAAFSAFWTVLAWRLEDPRYGLGPDVAGLFGIIGAVGVLAAPLAGRVADTIGPRPVIMTASFLTLLSWGIFWQWSSLPGLAVGVALLDFATQSALVSHQQIIFALKPEARARINTIMMGLMFVGGAGGAAMATMAWHQAQWPGVLLFGAVVAIIAVLVQMGAVIRKRAV